MKNNFFINVIDKMSIEGFNIEILVKIQKVEFMMELKICEKDVYCLLIYIFYRNEIKNIFKSF